MKLKKKNFISLYKSYSYERNRMLDENLLMKCIFPHFVISEKILGNDMLICRINKKWSVYQSNTYFNFGINSFYKLGIFINGAKKLGELLEKYRNSFLDKGYSLIKSRRMALEFALEVMENEFDFGLKKIDMSFILFFGKKQYIFDDVRILSNTAMKIERLKTGHDVITDLYLFENSSKLKKKLLVHLLNRQKLYERILTEKDEFDIKLLLTSSIPISIVFKDYKFTEGRISAIPQIPIGVGGYYYILKEYFGVDMEKDENKLESIDINGKKVKLFSIDNDIFVYNNMFIVDKNRSIITGKAIDIFFNLMDKSLIL